MSGKWLIVTYLVCIWLSDVAATTSSTTQRNDYKHYWNTRQPENETNSPNEYYRHRPWRWTTTHGPPLREREPRIFSRPRYFYWTNETAEFTCLAVTNPVRWTVQQPGLETETPAEAFMELRVNKLWYSKGSDGVYRYSSTITVFMDTSLNNTNLTCSIGNHGNSESIHLKVYKNIVKHVLLGESCSSDSECQSNAVCYEEGYCECDKFYVRDYFNGIESCVPRKVGLGEACIRNHECPQNAICDRVCVCASPYVSSNNIDCELESTDGYLDFCTVHSACQRWDPNASCKNYRCKCSNGYVYAQGKCWRKIWLGDACTSDKECYTIVDHSICRNITSGGFAECDCEVGYRISGRKCVEHWRSHMISLRTAFIASSCILGLILFCVFVIGIRSARLYVMQQKGRNCRNAIADEKNISISKYIPMRSKPDRKVVEEKQSVTFCPLPVLDLTWKVAHEPELRPVSISEEDRTVGIPENIVLIHQDSNDKGSAC